MVADPLLEKKIGPPLIRKFFLSFYVLMLLINKHIMSLDIFFSIQIKEKKLSLGVNGSVCKSGGSLGTSRGPHTPGRICQDFSMIFKFNLTPAIPSKN